MTWHDGQPREWMARAACNDADPELFFSAVPADTENALEICSWCPVTSDCLTYATATRAAGIWAGTTEDERRNSRRNQMRRDRAAEQVAS